MKRAVVVFLFLFVAACSAPKQYTIVRRSGSVSAVGQPWPDVGTWDAHAPRPGDRALIVAVEEYAFLPHVAGAIQNANDWQAYFQSRQIPVTMLVNRDASREKILEA